MNDELQQFQQSIVAAVQREFTRYSAEVKGEVDKIRHEVESNANSRAALEAQLRALAGAIEQSQIRNSQYQSDLQHALEERLTEFVASSKRRHEEMSARLGKVIDDANVGIAATVESATRPIVKEVQSRQDETERSVAALSQDLQRFDQQAAQIVEHLNQTTQGLDGRLSEVNREVVELIDQKVVEMSMRVDDVSSTAARQQAELTNAMGDKVESAEVRINERLVDLESRVNDEIGQRVADLDAHLGHVSSNLDETVMTLSDRIQEAHDLVTGVQQSIGEIREEISNVDADAIEEMKERIASALGQAELVRIESDRFRDEIEKTVEATNVRLTELETTVQDQTLDVETAVQLERLEEVERAVLMLDPDQFVRREDLDDITAAMAPQPTDDRAQRADQTPPNLGPPANAPLIPPSAEPTAAGLTPQPPGPS